MALWLGGCGLADITPAVFDEREPAGRQKIGSPYEVNGVWYTPRADPDYDEEGVASWYGEPFHGRRTASGEVYDMNALTAAHPTLPLPTRVRVTNLENGRSVVLRINDRGPFVGGRILDASRRAAQALGFYRQGTARVRVENLDGGSGTALARADEAAPAEPQVALASAAPADAQVYVQVGAFSREDNAYLAVRRLLPLGRLRLLRVETSDGSFYRVHLGPYVSQAEAQTIRDAAEARGYPGAFVTVDQ